MKALIKYLWCKIRWHQVQRDRVRTAICPYWWHIYRCVKCGEWNDNPALVGWWDNSNDDVDKSDSNG